MTNFVENYMFFLVFIYASRRKGDYFEEIIHTTLLTVLVIMVLSKKVLILEDNLLALSKILERLSRLEGDQPFDFCIITLSDYTQVENYVNNNPRAEFDIVLLDRDCKLGGSFHVLDIERFGAEKVIAISSVPEFNEQAKKRGVKRTILKDNQYLDKFAEKVVAEIEKMVRKLPLAQITLNPKN